MAKTNQEEQRKAPILRFKGFTNDWEQGKLKNITRQIKRTNSKISPILTISAKNGWMKQKDRFSRVIAGKELKNYIELHKNELSYNHGNSKYAKYGIIYVQRDYDKALVPKVYHSFMVVDGDPRFIENLSLGHKIDKELSKLITSGARQDGLLNINKNSFYSINLFYPTKKEQELISNLMDKINSLIALYERKISKLLLIKEALSNDIFNGNIKFIINQNYKTFQLKKLLIETKKFSKIENEYPLLSSTNDGIKIRKGRVDSSSNIGYKIINKNELVLSPQNLWLGNINVNFKFKNGIVSPSYKIFKVKDGVDIFLLDNFLHNPKMLYLYKVVSVQGASVVRRNLDFDAFMNLEIKLPEKCVQKKLGSLLYTLDELINLYRKKHTNLKQIKKELLDTMFI